MPTGITPTVLAAGKSPADDAGRMVMRRYALILVGVVTGLALLAGAALLMQFQRLDDQAAQALNEQVNSRSALLSARSAVAIQMVKRARDAMENALADPDPVSRETIAQLQQVANPESARRPVGTYWITATDDPAQKVEVLGDEQLATRINDREVQAGFMLARQFPADHESNPLLFRTTYVSADNRFIVAQSSRKFLMANYFADEWRREKSQSLGDILASIDGHDALAVTAARKSVNRQVEWQPPRAPAAVDFVQLNLMAFVYQGKALRGYVVMQFRAAGLVTAGQASQRTDAGRFYVLAPDGGIFDLAPMGKDDVKLMSAVPSWLAVAARQAGANAGSVIATPDTYAAAAQIRGTPWKLLIVSPRKSIVAKLLTDLLPSTLAILALLAGTSLMLIGFRRSFLRPAIALLERAQAPENSELQPSALGKMWAPWIATLDKGQQDAAQYLRSLEEQGQLRNAILGSAIDGIVTSDAAGVVTDFNPAAEAMFGWPREDIVGKTMDETIVPPAFRHAHRSGMAQYVARDDGGVIRRKLELQGLRRDGSLFPIELAIAEARVNDARIFIGYVRDLTTQQNSETELAQSREALHQSEKLASLGSLLAGVAHELNNPLAIVVGRAAILEEKLAGSAELPSLRKLRAAADRCSRIVKTFLAMARQSGPRRSRVQLNELVEGALDMSAYGLRADGIELCLDLYPALPSTSADSDQLVQVMINLIVNAQQAMAGRPGEQRLTIRTRHALRDKAVILEVEDSGPGIPANLITRVFEPFFTTKEVGAGTGMGLSVSKGMVEAHGGKLTVSRNGSRGATFRISLPITASDEARRMGDAAETPPPTRGRILIVDDEPEISVLLADCLAPLGLVCDLADGGAQALDLIEQHAYDAVITDVRMPGMDGIAFYQQVQARFPQIATKLAFVSGDVLHNDPARIAAIGDRPVIEKPFDPLQVREVVLKLLSSGDD